ncbi:MAG: helix-turn-helix domain-containing protein [Actinomycetota bacterium]
MPDRDSLDLLDLPDLPELEVLDGPEAATDVLDPLRSRVLAELVRPGSASSLAPVLGESRQKLNYHLRALEAHGLVRLVAERPRRGLTERVLRATARSYVVSPAASDLPAPDPRRTDRLSARYLLALAARVITEVAELARRADRAGRPAPVLAIDTEIRLASPEARAALADEVAAITADLAARYHDESADDGRWYRLLVASHPRPRQQATTDRSGGTDRSSTEEH